MIIAKKNYKINILVLFMEREVDVTIATVETLLHNIEDGVTISVLLNGGSRDDLRRLFTSSPHVYYYESAKNLGVAGGRNFLLDTKEARASDIIMFMDNDVIPPTDYVRSLSTFLIDRPEAGIVGASVLNVMPFFLEHADVFEDVNGVFGNTIRTTTSRRLRKTLVRNYQNSMFNHIGVDKDWYNAYFSSLDLRDAVKKLLGVADRKCFYSQLKANKEYTFSYFSRFVHQMPVSNVIGASQTFRRRLVDEIGGLNNAFNPYGYEDVDFSIRVLKKGYNNYIDTKTFLLHGTDARHATRQDFNLHAKMSNEFRCLTILYSIHFPERYDELIKRRIFYEYLSRHMAGEIHPEEVLYYAVKGYETGRKAIMDSKS